MSRSPGSVLLCAALVAALVLTYLNLRPAAHEGQGGTARFEAEKREREPIESLPEAVTAKPASLRRSEALAATTAKPGDLVARVVNVDGQRVDRFPVRIGVFPPGDRDHEALYDMTNADGEVRFAAADVARIQAQEPDVRLRVELDADSHVPVLRELEPGVIPKDPVVLEADMVRLEVLAVTAEGEPWTRRAGLMVQPIGFHYYSRRSEMPLVGWVPHGHGYELRIYGCGAHADGEETFPVPLTEVRQLEHTITLGPRVPAITGLIVGPDGEPLTAGTKVEALDRGRTGNGSRWFRSGEEGRFEYPLKLGEIPGQTKVFEFGLLDSGPESSHGAATARVQFVVPDPAAPLDLGTITLEPRPVLVSGRILLPEGVRARGIGVSPMVLIGGEWRRHPEYDNCSFVDELGRFVLHGEDLPGPERLKIVRGFREDVQGLAVAADLNFEPGAEGFEVPLVAPGTISARLADGVTEGRTTFHFALHLKPEGASSTFARPGIKVAGRALKIGAVPPGMARLELLDGRGGAPIAAWDQIEVRAEEETDLGLLTFPGKVASIRVTIEAPEGARPDVRYGPQGERPLRFRARRAENGSFELVSGTGPLDVLAFGAGCDPRLREGVAGDFTLRLDHGAEVSVTLAGQDELRRAFGEVAPDRALRLYFTPVDPELARLFAPADILALESQAMQSLRQPLPAEWTHQLIWPGDYTVRAEVPSSIDAMIGRPARDPLTPTVELGPSSFASGLDPTPIGVNLEELTVQALARRGSDD